MPHWRESSYITMVNPSQLLADLSDIVHTENPTGQSMRLGSIRESKLQDCIWQSRQSSFPGTPYFSGGRAWAVLWSCKKTSQTKSSCAGAYKNFASSCCSASLVLLWNFSWTRLIFGLQSTELLVYGWGLGHPRPSAVKPVCHASASTRPPLFIPELSYTKITGEQIKFGSVAGGSAFHHCSFGCH